MSNTVTNYLNRINVNFPVRGQDNDSQGFRDNWKNIHEAIFNLNSELEEVGYYTVKTNNLSKFYGNTFEEITIKNASNQLYQLDSVSNSIKINYSNGSYQKFQINPGIYQLSVTNWPASGKSGRVRLAVKVLKNEYTAINFDSNYISLNPQSNLVPNLFKLTIDNINIFELWNEEGSDIVYVIYINTITTDNDTFTSTTWTNKLKLGNITSDGETNFYYTGTNKSTIVRRGNEFGELGLVPNRITKKLIDSVDRSTTDPIELLFDNASDIVPNAFLYISLTNTIFTVTEVTTSSIFIKPGDFNVSLLDLENPITITNPDFYQQSKLLSLSSISANTSTGIPSNFLGNVYADKHRLEVTYKKFGNNNTNTFIITTLQTSTETSIVSDDIASTEFVHSLIPMGTIIMWYGKAADVPNGWTICDNKGSIASIINGQPGPIIKVPNLSDRFVAGGNSDTYDTNTGVYQGPGTTVSSTSTSTRGGLADTVVVNHSHSAIFIGTQTPPHHHLITDTEHTHINGRYTYLTPNYETRRAGNAGNDNLAGKIPNLDYSAPMLNTSTGITVDSNSAGTPKGTAYIYQTGEEGRYKNIPPFYALYYIMKISGISNDNLPEPSGDSTLPTEPSPWPSMPTRPGPPGPPPVVAPAPILPTRILTVSPSPLPTFTWPLNGTSNVVTFTCTNSGNSSMKIYAVQSNTTENIYGTISNAGTFIKILPPGGSFTFDLSYTNNSQYPPSTGTYYSIVSIAHQNSQSNTEFKYLRINQIIT